METNDKLPTAAAPADKRSSILGDVLTYGMTSVLARGLTFFLIPLYTRFLSPADYGILSLVNQIGMVISTVLVLNGIGLATMTFFLQANSETERKQVVSCIASMMGIGVTAAAFISLPIAPLITKWFDLDYSNSIFTLGCLAVLSEVIPVVPFTLMQARIESRRFMQWHVGSLAARLLATILVVAVLRWGIVGILLVRTATGFIAGGILLIQEIRDNRIRPPRKLVKKILGYILPFVPAGVFGLIRGTAQRFFILAYSGLTDLGIYSLGVTLCGVVHTLLITPFNKVWNAKMYAVHEAPDAEDRLGQVATKFAVLYMLGAVPLILFGKELLAIISPNSYSGAVQVFIPILIAGHIETYVNVADQVFIVHHRTHYKPYIVGAVAGLTILFYWYAIPRWGILGAAWGAAAASLVRAVIIYVLSRRIFRIRFEAFTLAKLWLITAFAITIGAQLPTCWWAMGIKVGLVLSWAISLRLLAIVPKEDINSLLLFVRSIPSGLHARKAQSES